MFPASRPAFKKMYSCESKTFWSTIFIMYSKTNSVILDLFGVIMLSLYILFCFTVMLAIGPGGVFGKLVYNLNNWY